MKWSKQTYKCQTDEVGGAFEAGRSLKSFSSLADEATQPEAGEDEIEIYAQPSELTSAKRFRAKAVSNRLKAKQIAENRLNRLSNELLELVDEIRLLNPSMADALDDAWNATDTALEILLTEDAW